MAAVSSTVFLADNGMSMNGGLIIFSTPHRPLSGF
jgi:hypothetical protein